MHRHLYVVRRSARHVPARPAKVVQLEARRQARLDVARAPAAAHTACRMSDGPRRDAAAFVRMWRNR